MTIYTILFHWHPNGVRAKDIGIDLATEAVNCAQVIDLIPQSCYSCAGISIDEEFGSSAVSTSASPPTRCDTCVSCSRSSLSQTYKSDRSLECCPRLASAKCTPLWVHKCGYTMCHFGGIFWVRYEGEAYSIRSKTHRSRRVTYFELG